MTREEAKILVVNAVTALQGCKATELAASVAFAFDEHSLPELIDELVAEGELLELEYEVPTMPYRSKSFLLPKGTSLSLVVG